MCGMTGKETWAGMSSVLIKCRQFPFLVWGGCGFRLRRFQSVLFRLLSISSPFLFAVTYMKIDDEAHLVFTADRSPGRDGFDVN
jgi:hypothetical protein